MSLLLNHPAVLEKARAELDNYVGHSRLVDEPDLTKLPYLQNIIKETLRLFPAVPHESSDDCTIGGYDVPRSTILIVNAWAIHRSHDIWEDTIRFKPERLENLEGKGYKFVPFGIRRRAYPGAGLAHRVMALTLAALIQSLECGRIDEEEVDLIEATGLTMPKAKPLEVRLCAKPATPCSMSFWSCNTYVKYHIL
ncbi:Cytochrome P450 [Melia azedarach]|uniref:Cytochrome P450 n=1 Tax=Melia azedarach TaxID=155640 RepID=A0ACC1WS16_MELAZ|nr:Cytochrome P450 [Melia azedarach]